MSAFPYYHCLYTDCRGRENLEDKKMQFKDKKQFKQSWAVSVPCISPQFLFI